MATNKKDEYRIEFFNSPEEENEATARFRAERTPEENFQAAYSIIKAMYAKELEEPGKKYDRITFIQPSDQDLQEEKEG